MGGHAKRPRVVGSALRAWLAAAVASHPLVHGQRDGDLLIPKLARQRLRQRGSARAEVRRADPRRLRGTAPRPRVAALRCARGTRQHAAAGLLAQVKRLRRALLHQLRHSTRGSCSVSARQHCTA
jgi:hypothetical protein